MGNSSTYIINPDGSVSETTSSKEIDDMVRAMIRVASMRSGKTVAYRAQRKAIKFVKEHTKYACPQTYVEDLELREFPVEFQRAELGKKYRRLIWCASTLWITGIGILGYYWIYKGFKDLDTKFKKS